MDAIKSTLLGHMPELGLEDLPPEFAPFENGLDSLGVLVLMSAISEEYGVEVTAKELKEARTLEGMHLLALSKKA